MDTGGIDDDTRERIFQEELARRSSHDTAKPTRWVRFRSIAWYWQALAWTFASPIIALLWGLDRFPQRRRLVWSAAGGLALLYLVVAAAAVAPPPDTKTADRELAVSAGVAEDTAADPTTTVAPAAQAPAPSTTVAPPTTVPPTTVPPTTVPPTTVPPTIEAPAARGTVSQRNARRKAADYLDFSSFSRSGLIHQLVFEGFSQEDSTYGVDALDTDWNSEAAKKAADYLDMSSFSRSGLIHQLVFEGFTQAQAEYGVGTTGL